ncbi:tetratricopeptide repeat protein [bacterium]|nr:tetratricopeptide repeat protein [bacterium]
MNDKFKDAFKFHQEGKLTQARDCYVEILKKEPQNHEVLDLLGILYMQVHNYQKSLEYIKRAIEINPKIYYIENLGKLYIESENFESASEIYEILVKNNPKNYDNWFNLGMAYKNLSQWDKSKQAYIKAIEIAPDRQDAYINLAYLCFNENNPQGAVECYRKALEINSEDWETAYFLSLALMQTKNYKEGLKYFEERLCRQSAIISQEKTYPHLIKEKKLWRGNEETSDKVLYTYYEAGFGDIIMFYRFMPELVKKFKKVIFKPQHELVELFKYNSYGAEIMDMYKPEQNIYFDYHLPFLSVPYILRKTENNMFADKDKKYLKADLKIIKYFKEKYFNNNKFKIGIKWQGNTFYEKERVLKVEDFFNLFELPNTQFYSCQTFEGSEEFEKIQKKYNVINLAPEFTDFAKTAGALDNMDLVICNDTSLAHLAGAMGKPCYVLLPHVYNWRWHYDLSKCDWYNCVKIFAQKSNGDWESVFKKVEIELKKLILKA